MQLKLSFLLAACASAKPLTRHSDRELAEGWRSDLPWIDLTAKLSPSASLLDTSPADFIAECLSEFDRPLYDLDGTPNRTNHALIDQPSGLCVDHVFCAFEDCFPDPNPSNLTLSKSLEDLYLLSDTTLYSDLPSPYKNWIDDPSNPSYNLPSKVLFPAVASDVVAAVEFAKEHGLELSVKNSGHHYAGASTKKNTLHINMNRYTRYADMDIGISDCYPSSNNSDSFNVDLSDQPCRLALARNKSAFIRVGGGENWDKSIRAVKRANEANEGGYKYHIVSGAAGTVSPMGWTFQGGLPGTAGGRLYGFGVDQVLMIEMVLPNGNHVKFGPTEWETAEGYDVPKTLKVSGVCRSNPYEIDEDNWEWEACPDDESQNFDDLWFAVRGGGGGTWGVVTSIYLQLHEYRPLELFSLTSYICATDEPPEVLSAFGVTLLTFLIKFFHDPNSINITEADSNACSGPPADYIFCYGRDSATTMFEAWKQYLKSASQSLIDVGIPESSLEKMHLCNATIFYAPDMFDALSLPPGSRYQGKLQDNPMPNYYTDTIGQGNVILPKKWMLENLDAVIGFELLFQQYGASFLMDGGLYKAFGGRSSKASSDQANSLSEAHREGGFMTFRITHDSLSSMPFYSDLLPMMYNTSSGDSFPGFIGSNHVGTNTLGPLKSDWTEACPMEWTLEERADKCISTQEVVYGTKLMERLQSIKDAVDPNKMFDCNNCIGNKATSKSHEELFLDTSPAEAGLNTTISATTEPVPTYTDDIPAPSDGALNSPVSAPVPTATSAAISLFLATGYFHFLFGAIFFFNLW
ncbi:hypothetical protein ACHAXA_000427 [Cyclostephanos tholiformis]|uniref:FAD-binding PCMH-type domain-containing protein n=1 Tax=Cyclostephanos tholiformis TaxID=382380 RepID=A0ABD3R5M1_9STRA